MITFAAILSAEDEPVETAAASIEHCEECDYRLHSIVRTWDAAYDLLRANLVQVIVIARRDTWAPRIEYAERRNQRNQRTITSAGTTNGRWRRARVVRRYR